MLSARSATKAEDEDRERDRARASDPLAVADDFDEGGSVGHLEEPIAAAVEGEPDFAGGVRGAKVTLFHSFLVLSYVTVTVVTFKELRLHSIPESATEYIPISIILD